jgi:hypothetical protein
MHGTVLGVHNGRGVLTFGEGRRLEFSLSEWRSPGNPEPGQNVDFLEENGEARAVFLALPTPTNAPSPQQATTAPAQNTAAQTSTPLTLGVISVCCLVLGFVIPIGVPTIVSFVVGVIGAGQARRHGDDTALVLSRIGWITSLILLLLVLAGLIVSVVLWTQFGMPAILRSLTE